MDTRYRGERSWFREYREISRSIAWKRSMHARTNVQTMRKGDKRGEGRGDRKWRVVFVRDETRRDPPLFVDSALRTGISKVIYLGRENKRAGSTWSICFPFLFFLIRAFNCENFIQFIPFTALRSTIRWKFIIVTNRRRINIFETIFWKDKGSKISMQKKKEKWECKNGDKRCEVKRSESRNISRRFLIRVVSGYSPSEREARYPRREEGSS